MYKMHDDIHQRNSYDVRIELHPGIQLIQAYRLKREEKKINMVSIYIQVDVEQHCVRI